MTVIDKGKKLLLCPSNCIRFANALNYIKKFFS